MLNNYISIIGLILSLIVLFTFSYALVEGYQSTNDPIVRELHRQLSQLDPKLDNIKVYDSNETYTINKKRVYLCTKDKDGRYYDRNSLAYALCHEYSHVLCDEVGHTAKFWTIFENLLAKAKKYRLYDPSIPMIQNYCGYD